MIDYAAPMMKIEKLLKDMHNDLLNGTMNDAIGNATLLIVEAKLLQNTLWLMREKEQEHALRQQAETV